MSGAREAAPAFLLVPTERHVEAALRARGDALEGGAATLRAFLRQAAEALSPERAVATAETSRLAAARALDAAVERGERDAATDEATRARSAAALDAALGALRSAGTPRAALDTSGSPRGLELGRAMAFVDAELDRARRLDARALGATLASATPSASRLAALLRGASTVELSGFASLDGDTCSALEAMHVALRTQGGAGVRVELPRFVDAVEDPASAAADSLERRWASLADAPDLSFREAAIRAPRSVVTARDADGEARSVVRAVLDAIDEGAAPERIAVTLPRLDDASLAPLFAALADARVPFREPRGRSAASTPLGRAVLALFDVARGPVTRNDVLELLRAPGLHPGAVTAAAAERDATIRAASLAHRLRDVPVAIDRTGRFLVDGLARETAERPDEAWMPNALRRLLDLARFVAGAGSRREVASRVAHVFDRLEIGRTSARALSAALSAERDDGLGLSGLASAARTGQAVHRALAAWAEAAERLGAADDAVTFARASAELELALRGESAAPAGAAAGASAITIGRARDLAGLDHDLVVVMGLEEGAFDRVEEGGLVDEALRRALPAGLRPPPRAEMTAARRAELLGALAGARRLVFTHASGTDAEPAPPHRLVREALAEGAPHRVEPLARVAPTSARIDPRSRELGALARGKAPAGDLAPRVDAERARAAFFLDPRAPPAAFTGRFAETDAARAHVARAIGGTSRDAPASVTSIERAASCPFLAFSRRVLKADRRDELDEAADGRERGLLVHTALEVGFQAAREAPPGDVEHALGLAREAAERALGLDAHVAPLRREALRAALSDALAVLEETFTSADPVRFLHAERRFGRNLEPPWSALEIADPELTGPSVFVEGVIDRIDASADRRLVRVVDYKTGAKLPALANHGKTFFQLQLYAEVARLAFSVERVDAHYVSVRPRAPIGIFPKREEARRAIVEGAPAALIEARKVLLRAWSGDGRPRPVHATSCARCSSRDLCRRPAVAPDGEGESS